VDVVEHDPLLGDAAGDLAVLQTLNHRGKRTEREEHLGNKAEDWEELGLVWVFHFVSTTKIINFLLTFKASPIIVVFLLIQTLMIS